MHFMALNSDEYSCKTINTPLQRYSFFDVQNTLIKPATTDFSIKQLIINVL